LFKQYLFYNFKRKKNYPPLLLITQFYSLTENPQKKIDIESITKLFRRRFELRNIGIEIFIRDREKSYYFVCEDESCREEVYNALIKRVKADCISEVSLEHVTYMWQQREISNYQYLLELNHVGNRSTSDLSQYPVFPWVIANYESEAIDLTDPRNYRDLSKPIGAINPRRLAEFKKRSVIAIFL
jgi:factor associated with neutral sphingomyelinase activation